MMNRRELVQAILAGSGVAALGGCATSGGTPSSAKVVVVGGGYGGATAAKYIRMLSDNSLGVVLIEPSKSFVSCPMSNLVVGGVRQMADITSSYDGLRSKHGVTVVHDMVSSIDATKKTVKLAGGAEIRYDKLVLSPGIELMFDGVQGLKQANTDGQILQAWKAGSETLALFKQLEAMRDGGVFAITIPEAPYRCPPGPYERASVVAAYLKKNKPKSKVLILDANQDVTSKGPLFKKAWADLYGGMLEYRSQHKASGVDAKTLTVKFEVQDDVKADVLNVLPPHACRRLGRAIRIGQRQCTLVPRQLPNVRIDCGQGHSRYRRFDPGSAADAQVGPHGQQPCQGGCRGDRCRIEGHRDQSSADVDQHLLQLCEPCRSDSRRQRSRVRDRREDVQDDCRFGRRVGGQV